MELATTPSHTPSASVLGGLLTAHVDALVDLTIPQQGIETLWSASWSTPELESSGGDWSVAPPVEEEDFVFAYALPGAPALPSPASYAAAVLGVLLDVLDLLDGDRVLHVREVDCGSERAAVPLHPAGEHPDLGPRVEGADGVYGRQPLHSIASTEPAIAALARHWALVAALADVRAALPQHAPGGAAGIDGFRLRRTGDWVVDSGCHPSEVYEYLARVCNVACNFCYLFGNPSELAVARGKKVVSGSELDTRLRYFDPAAGRALFRAQWEINEFLVDPKLPELLRALRERVDTPFYFITNGSPLTQRVIDLLAEVKPVTLIISTNTLEAPLRAQVMNERRGQTETALTCLERLHDLRIPFGISLVATPEFTLDHLWQTIERTEPLRPAFVRVNLPGFTRAHPYKMADGLDARWHEVTTAIREMRSATSTPLLLIPSAYEEGFFNATADAPHVLGCVPGSPAARAGLRAGDLVTRVGVFDIDCRAEAQALLGMLRGTIRMTVERGPRRHDITFDASAGWEYPYCGPVIGKYVFPHGVVMSPSLSPADAQAVEAQLASPRTRTAWVATSPLMLPSARQFVARWLTDLSERITLLPVEARFLGGNIKVLDMCTVGDIHKAVTRQADGGCLPDSLLLPGTGFNFQGRDIAGRHWGDLERLLGIPVRLLDASTQFLF